MPANPNNVARREVLSEDYHDEKLFIDFYTNSCVRIYRADEDATSPDDDAMQKGQTLLVDNLEKRELLKILKEEI